MQGKIKILYMKRTFLFLCVLCALPLAAKKPQKQPKAAEPSVFDLLQAAWTEATGDTATLVLDAPKSDTQEGQTISSEQMTPGGAHALERLQGQVNNVEIISGTGVNDEAIIRFRQAPSILAGSAPPLYVIDGVAGADPHSISEQDIESVTILKDAEAIAQYGMRGSCGVVIVKTRKGK